MSKESNTPQMDLLGDFARMVEQIRMPGLDTAALVEGGRKDIEALVAANRSLYEGLQALSGKQAEILKQTAQDIQDAAKNAAAGVGMGDPVKQAELARTAFSQALADMKELAEIARQSQIDAMAGFSARATEHANEVRKLMQLP